MMTSTKTDVTSTVMTQTPLAARPTTATAPRRRAPLRLRQAAAIGLLAPVLALAACSGDPSVTADPTAPAATTPAATETSATPSETTTSEVPTATATAPAKMSVKDIQAVIKDPALGHTITATRVARNMSWPTGNPVASEEFEIVGVWVVLNAGSRYSASIEPAMFSLITADPKRTIQPTTEFTKRWGATQLKPAPRAKTTSGWLFFKVDRGTSPTLGLAYNRPAYEVSTTDKNISAQTFTISLTK